MLFAGAGAPGEAAGALAAKGHCVSCRNDNLGGNRRKKNTGGVTHTLRNKHIIKKFTEQ